MKLTDRLPSLSSFQTWQGFGYASPLASRFEGWVMLSDIGQYRNLMLAITSRAANHLAGTTPDGIGELAACRSAMANLLLRYSQFVHREIFEPLVRSGTHLEAVAAKEMKVECICLVEEFRSFTSRWEFTDVAGAWQVYQPQASDFRLRIERHLDRVTALSDPVLANVSPQEGRVGTPDANMAQSIAA